MSYLKSFISEIVGPPYNYTDAIENPAQMNVSDGGGVGSLWTNVGSMASYLDTLTFGTKTFSSPFEKTPSQVPLGNRFFIKSGKCGDNSKDECNGKDRYIYIDNIPTGKIPCFDQLGIKLPATDFKGLIPGMLQNIGDINPVGIFNSLAGKGNISDECYLRKEKVGSHENYKIETRCSPKNQPIQCVPEIFEKFENKEYNLKWENHFFIIGIIILIIIIFNYTQRI